MFSIAFFIVGYLWSSSEVFGTELVNGLEWLYYWFCLVALLEVSVALLTLIGMTGIGALLARKLPHKLAGFLTVAGSSMFAAVGAFKIIAFVIAKIMVTGWLVESIDINAVQFSELNSNQWLGLGVIVGILVLNPLISKLIEKMGERAAMKKMARSIAKSAMSEALAEMAAEAKESAANKAT